MLNYKIKNIPKSCGVYIWYNNKKEIIYIGKAKNLFNRIHSYFTNKKDIKTITLMSQVADIDFILTKNENESLELEANLIQKHRPKFNILLKEKNNYPYIIVTNETNPRIIYTRLTKKYHGKYYGPIAIGIDKYGIYNLLNKIFPLRKCSTLPKRKCIYYEMKQCLGPCINKIDQEKYNSIKHGLDCFLNGDVKNTIQYLHQQEKQYNKSLNYEMAEQTYKLITTIKSLKQNWKSYASIKNKTHVDIVGYYQKNNYLSISVYSYVETKLIDMQNQIIEISIDIETSIFEFLSAYYYKHQNPPKTLYVKLNKAYLDELNETFKNIKFKKPEKGKFKSIINIANLNAKKHYSSDYLVYEDEKCRNANAYTELTKIFNLGENTLIHVFDMSNYGKNERVGGMIALTNGRFNKKLYRKFIIRNQNAISDIDMFKEVIKRQYERMIIEKQELPNLVIVDGGKNQIKIVQEQFKRLNLEIKIIGLVKNNKHETDHILTIQNKIISLNKNSGLYFYLVNIQNEVHRYAINFLKKKKIKTIV